MGRSFVTCSDKQMAGDARVETDGRQQLLKSVQNHTKPLGARGRQAASLWVVSLLTEHHQGGGSLLVPSRVGGVLAGIASGIGHPQVRNPDGRVLKAVLEEDNPVLEGRVGETPSVGGMVHGNVVPLAVAGLPYPRYLLGIVVWSLKHKHRRRHS